MGVGKAQTLETASGNSQLLKRGIVLLPKLCEWYD